MAGTTFRQIDETAFDDDSVVSTAHLKYLGENSVYLLNERITPHAIGFPRRYNATDIRRPQLSTVRWSCYMLGQVWVPSIPGQNSFYGRIRITGDVQDYDSRMMVYSSAVTNPTPMMMDGDTATGTDNAKIISVGDFNEEFIVKMQPGTWNTIWIASRCGFANSFKYISGSATVFVFGKRGEDAVPNLRFDADEVPTTTVPNIALAFGGSTSVDQDTNDRIYNQLYTVVRVDVDDPPGNYYWYIAEYGSQFGFDSRITDQFGEVDPDNGQIGFFIGQLGSINLSSISIDNSQALNHGDQFFAFFSQFRAFQAASSTRFRTELTRENAAVLATLPQISAFNNVYDPQYEYPGIYYVNGYASSVDAAPVIAFNAETTVFTCAYVHEHEKVSGFDPAIECSIPFFWADFKRRNDAKFGRRLFAFKLKVKSITDTVLATAEKRVSIDSTRPPGYNGATDANIYQLAKIRAAGNGFDDTSTQSLWGYDGLTLSDETQYWMKEELRVAYDFVSGTSYRISVTIEQLEENGIPKEVGTMAIAAVGMRLLYNIGG